MPPAFANAVLLHNNCPRVDGAVAEVIYYKLPNILKEQENPRAPL